MASELQLPDDLISATQPTTTAAATSPNPTPIDHPSTTTTTNSAAAKIINNPPKRQRRPSVRLGEIGGDPSFEPHTKRPAKTWRFHKDPSLASKTSKTRPLTNLVNNGASNFQDFVDFTHRKPKNSKPTKRVRTNWNKLESTAIPNGVIESSNAFQEENENNEEFREFEPEGSESPLLKENSPVNSVENMGLHFWDQQQRSNNGVQHNEANSPERRDEENVGVREWLIGLGLVRYAPVFEIHEVDDEVLPMLTLEDLKDMGINAVGSRRKMYSAIIKMRK